MPARLPLRTGIALDALRYRKEQLVSDVRSSNHSRLSARLLSRLCNQQGSILYYRGRLMPNASTFPSETLWNKRVPQESEYLSNIFAYFSPRFSVLT